MDNGGDDKGVERLPGIATASLNRDLFYPEQLEQYEPHEKWILSVSWPEPLRLGRQAEKPFKSRSLDQSRGLRLAAGKKIESCTDPGHHRGIDPSQVFGHPVFLFGRA